MTLPSPSTEQLARLYQAWIAKATRILVMVQAPLGLWGDLSEFGQATVRPDWQIRELLYGFHHRFDEIVALDPPVTPDDVIRAGLGLDPATFPTDRLPDVQRAIDAAWSWIHDEVWESYGVA